MRILPLHLRDDSSSLTLRVGLGSSSLTLRVGVLLTLIFLVATAEAQVRTRFPPQGETTTLAQGSGAPPFRIPPGSTIGPVSPPGPTFGAPSGTTAPGVGGAALQPPTFDAYSTSPGAASTAPSLAPSSGAPYGTYPGAPYSPPASGSPYGTYGAAPGTVGPPPSQPPWTPPYGAPPGGNPYYSPFPQQPPAAYPNGLGGTDWGSPQPGPYLKLFSDLRLRYTWLAGRDDRDLDINDVDIAVNINFPNLFNYCGAPLRISPGFSFHFWDGPDTVPPRTADLPGQAYSAFIEARWDPKFSQIFGGELAVSVGTYTDFDSVTSNSIRVQGVGLLVVNINETLAIKGGIEYLDRVKIKLLPAGGIVWRPNPQTRWDIYFPRPKLAQYLNTWGNTDIWWYVGGEYGGGSWTIQRAVVADQADINDIRLLAGVEWTHGIGVKGFFEVGYVFDREVVYRFNPVDNFDPTDTVMLRAGLSF